MSNKCCLQATQSVVFCYSSPKGLRHTPKHKDGRVTSASQSDSLAGMQNWSSREGQVAESHGTGG